MATSNPVVRSRRRRPRTEGGRRTSEAAEGDSGERQPCLTIEAPKPAACYRRPSGSSTGCSRSRAQSRRGRISTRSWHRWPRPWPASSTSRRARSMSARRRPESCRVLAEHDCRERLRSAGGGVTLAVPMTYAGRHVGRIELSDTAEERIVGDDEMVLAQAMADQAVAAIENAKRVDELRQVHSEQPLHARLGAQRQRRLHPRSRLARRRLRDLPLPRAGGGRGPHQRVGEGLLPARHRQDRHHRPHPAEARPPQRRGAGADAAARRHQRPHRLAALLARGAERRAPPPRGVGRQRVSRRAARRGDLAAGAHPAHRRFLRRHVLLAALRQGAHVQRRPARAARGSGSRVRSRARRSVHRRSSSVCAPPASVRARSRPRRRR